MAYTAIRTKTLTVVRKDAVKRGFLATLVGYAAKRETFKVEDLTKRFAGKLVEGKKVSTERIVRYAYYCEQNGIFAAPAPKEQRTTA